MDALPLCSGRELDGLEATTINTSERKYANERDQEMSILMQF